MRRNRTIISLLAKTAFLAVLASCSIIDDDLSNCPQPEPEPTPTPGPEPEPEPEPEPQDSTQIAEVNYELQLITNLNTELSTELTTQADMKLSQQLRTHLGNVFTDFAHDVDLSFYDTQGDSLRLQHDQHIMDANQASYTLDLPKRQYMHLATANIVENEVVSLVNDEKCHKARLQQLEQDTIDSHTTGLFTARQPMEVLEGVDQNFDVHLYMANCAACLAIDPQGHDVSGIKVYSTGFATGFNICDSTYIFPKKSPIVRTNPINMKEGNEKIGFCSITFPSKRLKAEETRTYIETEDPFVDKTGEKSQWEFRVYVPQPSSSKTRSGDEIHITETIIHVSEPLHPGQLIVINCKIGERGDIIAKEPEVSTSVTLDWKPGLIFTN